jgi:uncharacterized cupredoxin-like copper-binding protein
VREARYAHRLSALALGIGVLALASCGSSSPSSTPSVATTTSTPASSSAAPKGALTLEANREGQLKYNKSELTANADKVTIDMTNMSPLMHNVTVESSAHAILGATPTFQGGTRSLTLNLKPGIYKFFCSVPGHRQAGMEGTLTVK